MNVAVGGLRLYRVLERHEIASGDVLSSDRLHICSSDRSSDRAAKDFGP